MSFDIRSIKLGKDVTAEDIAEDLEFLDDWEERYRYIIDLGKQLPGLPDDLKTEDRFVRGCQSQVSVSYSHLTLPPILLV